MHHTHSPGRETDEDTAGRERCMQKAQKKPGVNRPALGLRGDAGAGSRDWQSSSKASSFASDHAACGVTSSCAAVPAAFAGALTSATALAASVSAIAASAALAAASTLAWRLLRFFRRQCFRTRVAC